jgi:hypothetical protein
MTIQSARKTTLKVAEVCSAKRKPVKQASTALAAVIFNRRSGFVLQYK